MKKREFDNELERGEQENDNSHLIQAELIHQNTAIQVLVYFHFLAFDFVLNIAVFLYIHFQVLLFYL